MKPVLGRLFFPLLALYLVSCNQEKRVNADLVDIYVDIRLANQEFGINSPKTAAVRSRLLQEHGWSPERYSKEQERVMTDPDLWAPFQQAVVARLDSLVSKRNPKPKTQEKPSKKTSPQDVKPKPDNGKKGS